MYAVHSLGGGRIRPLAGLLLTAALVLCRATPAAAIPFQLDVEAWPVPSTEICAAPCYEVRVFLHDSWAPNQVGSDAAEAVADIAYGGIPVPYLPEPASGAALAGALSALAILRARAACSLPRSRSDT